jgi:hypothetical protein
MTSDIVMIALVLAGIALTIAYFYVAVLWGRRHARRERQKDAALRKLHTERLRSAAPSPPGSDRQIAA